MRISEVQYQVRAHRILQRALHAGRVPHAYVFHGPAGVGKEMLATRFARVLLCGRPGAAEGLAIGDDLAFSPTDACGRCDSCRLVHGETHPDLHRIYRQLTAYHPDYSVRARKALDLSVDVIRHFLIEKAGSKPQQGRAKVFIIREAELLTNAAQNALLKTLEEPPDLTFIILLASSLDTLLPTTLSRCQPVPFAPLPPEFISVELRRRQPDLSEAGARFLASFCDGQLGTAIHQAEDQVFGLKQQWGRSLAQLTGRGAAVLAKQLQEDAKVLAQKHRQRQPETSDTDATRVGMRTLLAMSAIFFRDVLHSHAGRGDQLINGDQSEVVKSLAKRFDCERAIKALREICLAESQLERNANPALATESLFGRLARLG